MSARKIAAALGLLALPLALTGCATSGADGRPTIVVTTNILGDVVTELVGDQADVTTLMPPDGDPHSFEISAQQAAEIGRADLVIANGLGLEEGIAQHVETAGADGVPVVEAGALIDALPYASDGADDAAIPDPHFWTDPTVMAEIVTGLSAAIAEHAAGIDPDALAAATDAYLAELDALDADMAAAFARIPDERRALVTNHHVFGYLAARYDFRVIGAVLPSGTTLASPSAADLAELASAIRDAGVPTIFADSSQPDRLAQVLADEAGVEVAVVPLVTESLTAADGRAPTYLDMMRVNTEDIVAGLA